jgi:peptide/nickel transport system ATP-binding protein
MTGCLLDIRNLKVHYFIRQGIAKAVDDVSLTICKGEAFGLAGESACGKSTLALSIMGILPAEGKVVGGQIVFEGQSLLEMSEPQLDKIRWKRMSIIFQSAMNALNPVKRVGEQIAEAISAHEGLSHKTAMARAAELFRQVGLDPSRTTDYPHHFSGGMKQRVMIAMALACSPSLLIADEPVTALDVMVQAQVLDLLKKIQKKEDLAILLITHDLSILAGSCDRIGIMYAGRLVEYGDTESIFKAPLHPYTRSLMAAIPDIRGSRSRLESIPGYPPDVTNLPGGCRFYPRCRCSKSVCEGEYPPLSVSEGTHYVACHGVSRTD